MTDVLILLSAAIGLTWFAKWQYGRGNKNTITMHVWICPDCINKGMNYHIANSSRDAMERSKEFHMTVVHDKPPRGKQIKEMDL